MLSFIDVGRRVVSSSDNFLIFGGDYKNEESEVARRFIVKFIHDMDMDMEHGRTWTNHIRGEEEISDEH